MKRSRTFLAIPPGATIKEQLTDRGMSQKEFAVRMGMSEKHISRLINGEVQLTVDTARKLEMVLGVPAQFWCNLETIYREKLIRVREENEMDEDIEIAKRMPYKEMVRNGWIEDVSGWAQRVICLRKYFEVARLTFLKAGLLPGIVCTKISESGTVDYELAVWSQKAKLEARKIRTGPVDTVKLNEMIPQIREAVAKVSGKEYDELRDMLAKCGIALTVLPHIGGSSLHGVTFSDGGKIVVGLADCEGDSARFRFSLFHELAHILCGHIGKIGGTTAEDEKEADRFAEKALSGD